MKFRVLKKFCGAGRWSTGARLRGQGANAHALQERAHVQSTYLHALTLELTHQHALAHEGVL